MNEQKMRINYQSIVFWGRLMVLCATLGLANGFNIDVDKFLMLRGDRLQSGSYFGYSVAITKNAGNRWLLVGAPRSNDPAMPSVIRPGGVFACPQGGSNCMRLNIDSNTEYETVDFDGKRVTFRHGKNDAWLGGTIETPSAASASQFVTCAHKWYNTYNPEEWYMQGMCYEVPYDFNMNNVRKIPALTDSSFVAKNIGKKVVWNYAFGGLGMSVHYTSNMDNLLLGAPGLLDWIGGFVTLEGLRVKYMDNALNDTEIAKPYLGYASTSGKYFADDITYFAIGAPGADMIGMVLFFRANEHQYWLQKTALILQGRDDNDMELPINSYYGSVLCTVDVNKDNKDDLLVAAPLYSPTDNSGLIGETEIGAVFVYLGSRNNMSFVQQPKIIKGLKAFGRFGSAVVSLGDINLDTFNDVAIGAPYEDNLRGAVYIYNGYTEGLWPIYTQRIAAANLNTGLAGFGISIASGTDINNDNVNDVVVGSYLSDHAVVLYGQPVIVVNAELKIVNDAGDSVDVVEVDDKDKFVSMCFRYADRRCSFIRLNVTYVLDVEKGEQSRLRFNKTNLASTTLMVRVFNSELQCTPRERFYTKTTSDIVSDVMIIGDYVVEEISCQLTVGATISRFNGANPGDISLQLKKQVKFRNVCPNNICRTNLKLSSEANYTNIGGYFLIGNEDLSVNVRISKTGDAAYGTVFYIIYPRYLSYKKVETIEGEYDVSCTIIAKEDNSTEIKKITDQITLSCLAGNPIVNDTGVGFKMMFKVPLDVTESSMELQMKVSTLSNELQPLDNNQTLSIGFRHSLEADFNGVSTYEEIYIDDSKNRYEMKLIYELHNKGPSMMKFATANISFPQVQTAETATLYLNKTEVKCDRCIVNCIIEQSYVSPPVFIFYNNRFGSKTDQPLKLTPTQTLNCSSSQCSSVKCSIGNLRQSTSAVFYLNFVIDKAIQSTMAKSAALAVVSVGDVAIDKTNLISSRTLFRKQLDTTIRKKSPPPEPLPWWIILVSVLGGVLLIALIILILWKCGFFKRKTRDELEKRKSMMPDSGNKVNNPKQGADDIKKKDEKKRDSYTDSEGGIIDHEQPPDVKNQHEKY